MRNSVIQALITRIRLIMECRGMRDLQFHTNDFCIIWRINYNATVIGINIRCHLIKQPGETVSAG